MAVDRSSRKPIAIVGAGGFGLEVAMLIEQINAASNSWEILGFFDDNVAEGTSINRYPVLGKPEQLSSWDKELYTVLAIGDPIAKRGVFDKIHNENIRFPTLIHPSVIMGDPEFVTIGEGGIFCARTILTTNITVGRHVLLNLSCTVGHESKVGDFSSFMPTCNISGQVTIGQSNYWGTGAKIIHGIRVGDKVTVGAGAVVVSDIPDRATAVGVPAKVIRIDEKQ